jgi:hypothetical protein
LSLSEKRPTPKSLFMPDPKMRSKAPYGWCDATAVPLETCRGQIELHAA